MIGSARAGTIAERHSCGANLKALKCAHSRARLESWFFLDSGLTWMIGRKRVDDKSSRKIYCGIRHTFGTQSGAICGGCWKYMSLVVTTIVALVLVLALWSYFGFVLFDLDEFAPASKLKKGWSVFLALALPAFAVSAGPGVSEETRLVLSGIGVTTILVPAIFPESERKSSSFSDWLYVRTIGRWFVDFVQTAIVYGIAILGSAFGSLWVAVYCGIAAALAIGRSMWVRLQREASPQVATPSLHWILVVFPIVALWAWLIVDSAKLKPSSWNMEFPALYKPHLESIIWAWVLARWPWLVHLYRSK